MLVKRTYEAYIVSNDKTAVRLIKRTYKAHFLSNGETGEANKKNIRNLLRVKW